MAHSDKPLVLIIGAAGTTGGSIVNGLLAAGNFRVGAMIRPGSLAKPDVEKLRSLGVEIRVGDVGDGLDKLKKLLEGVHTFISAVSAMAITAQEDLVRASKEVGVKRFIPCDFGTPGAKGVRELHDSKLAIREFIKAIDVPYTFIDVGWWMQLYLPLPLRSKTSETMKELTYTVVGNGEAKNLVTDRDHIGTFVARIVADPRTLNNAVIIWEDEVTQNVAHEIGEELSGEGDRLKSRRVYVTPEYLLAAAAAGREKVKEDPSNYALHAIVSMNEYFYSMFALQENTLENAKKLGYLDVRELYPDIAPLPFKEYAKSFYSFDDPGALIYQF
ncbi:NAD-P-binding protein [Daedaleopsis nitida]|nr:NAD-P-binding protein [Daedaleopsis nitida]